jgi:hypothetical protein
MIVISADKVGGGKNITFFTYNGPMTQFVTVFPVP